MRSNEMKTRIEESGREVCVTYFKALF